jgi:hypothetical protein
MRLSEGNILVLGLNNFFDRLIVEFSAVEFVFILFNFFKALGKVN